MTQSDEEKVITDKTLLAEIEKAYRRGFADGVKMGATNPKVEAEAKGKREAGIK